MATPRERKTLRKWWTLLFIVILAGAGYAAFVALKWDTLKRLSGIDDSNGDSERDVLNCSAGTHQEGQRCVSNPERPAPPAGASSAAPQTPAPGPP
jgi:hypothetical protein